MHHTDGAGVEPRHLIQHQSGIVLAAVVDDNDLEIVRHGGRDLHGSDDHCGNRSAVVITGKEDR